MENGIGAGENRIGAIILQGIPGMYPMNKQSLRMRMEGDANLAFKI